MSDKQEKMEGVLKNAGSVLVESLQRNFNTPYAFTIFVWPPHKNERTNYISNTEREDLIRVLRHTLMRLETNMAKDINDDVPPTNN